MKMNEPELAKNFGIPTIAEIKNARYVLGRTKLLPYLFAKENLLLPFDGDEESLSVAMADPLNLSAIDEMRLMLGKKIKPFVCPQNQIEGAIELCYREHVSIEQNIPLPGDLFLADDTSPMAMTCWLKITKMP